MLLYGAMFAGVPTGQGRESNQIGQRVDVSPANDDLLGMVCPSGFRNMEYGVWRSRCCGDEIVLYDGTTELSSRRATAISTG